jgi:hypothetical protein
VGLKQFFSRSSIAGLALFASVASASAAPIFSNPGILNANGDVHAIFAFSDADWVSYLSLNGGPTNIFRNHNLTGPVLANPGGVQTASVAGDTVDLGSLFGNLFFTLTTGEENFGTTKNYTTGVVNPSDGAFHANYAVTDHFGDFGVGPLAPGVVAALAALGNPSVTWVGFEDNDCTSCSIGAGTLPSDYDYNDLIFGFTSLSVVDEPGTLAILGAALLALGLRRRRR